MHIMTWTAQTVTTRLLWLAGALAVAGMLFAGAIPIRTPHALAGAGFLSYIVPGLLLAILLAGSAHGTSRNPHWTIPLSAMVTLIGIAFLIVVGLTLAYVCFDVRPGSAARLGCTGSLGAEWLEGASILCVAACPAISFLAFLAGVVARVRRRT
jgi:hypothetical protein